MELKYKKYKPLRLVVEVDEIKKGKKRYLVGKHTVSKQEFIEYFKQYDYTYRIVLEKRFYPKGFEYMASYGWDVSLKVVKMNGVQKRFILKKNKFKLFVGRSGYIEGKPKHYKPEDGKVPKKLDGLIKRYFALIMR